MELVNFVNLTSYESEMVRRWRNTPAIREWMYNTDIITEDEHGAFISSLKNTKNRLYWLVRESGGGYAGVISLVNIRWNHRHAYLGIYANPEERKPGRGSLLLSALLDVTFDILKLHTLKLEVIESNTAAIGLYKKFGFKEEGRLKEFVFKDGKWMDVIVMGMMEKEYSR